MAKLLVTPLLLLAITGTAFAGPMQPPRTEPIAARQQHRYWLSRDFQRLVFWQAPSQGGARR